jgi:hypothetical protein
MPEIGHHGKIYATENGNPNKFEPKNFVPKRQVINLYTLKIKHLS